MISEILSISQLNRLARGALEREFGLCWVTGEVSNLTRAPSGHCYFTLKDSQAQVRCAMFRNRVQLLPWRLENGRQVEARVSVTLYETRGDFQLNVEDLRPAGQGRLYEAFLRLKDKLAGEGLFAESRKRALPRLPRRIGVITSPRGAALQDVRVTLARRMPGLPVIVYPTLVQGAEAPAMIVQALANAVRRGECDLLLLVRGGGSLEDLWAFNDEALARAIAASPIPVISGVGHETDLTIADLVSDSRAATPTAAAELATAGWVAAAADLRQLASALTVTLRAGLERRMQRVDMLASRLVHPRQRMLATGKDLDHLASRLAAAGRRRIDERKAKLSNLATAFNALSPQATLARGYALVRDPSGQLVRSQHQIEPGMSLVLRFAEGGAETLVKRIIPD